ncbi:MAG: thymidylate kinase [Firmicutes bacterium]|nr:thymidylate kinase [Bacillota bacterium]
MNQGHKFISIEGTDGSGKKTQIDLLCKYLLGQGKHVEKIAFPNYESESSGPVKMYLGGELGGSASCLDAYQASALYAVDRLCTMKKVLSKLPDDSYVIFDRYVPSNMIHQAGKIKSKKERDKFLKWVDKFEYETLKLPRPDVVFFMDVAPSVSLEIVKQRTTQKTGKKIDIHERDPKHLTDAYNAAKYVAKKFKWTTVDCVKDGKFKSIEEIHDIIINHIK